MHRQWKTATIAGNESLGVVETTTIDQNSSDCGLSFGVSGEFILGDPSEEEVRDEIDSDFFGFGVFLIWSIHLGLLGGIKHNWGIKA